MDISDAKWERDGDDSMITFLRKPPDDVLAGYHPSESMPGKYVLQVVDGHSENGYRTTTQHVCDSEEDAGTLAETILHLTLDEPKDQS